MEECVCTAMKLADYVVAKCHSIGRPISNLQLQKILYFLQLAFCRRSQEGRLLFCEPFYAWPYGPVVPEVYGKYSVFGSRTIIPDDKQLNKPIADADIMSFVDAGICALSRMSAWDLVNASHKPGTPWSDVWKDGKGYKNIISNDLIRQQAQQ